MNNIRTNQITDRKGKYEYLNTLIINNIKMVLKIKKIDLIMGIFGFIGFFSFGTSLYIIFEFIYCSWFICRTDADKQYYIYEELNANLQL